MQTLRFADLSCRMVMRARATHTIVLLHGFGAPGDDLVSLADQLPSVHCVFPEAPIALGGMFGNGRAWWRIDMEQLQRAMAAGALEQLAERVPDGLEAASTKVRAALPAIAAHTGTPILLGGFSQGAMLSTDVALAGAELAGLALLSGSFIARARWMPNMNRIAGLRVLMSHGKQDAVLPYALAESLQETMQQAGAKMTWLPFSGGHEIPMKVARALTDWTRGA